MVAVGLSIGTVGAVRTVRGGMAIDTIRLAGHGGCWRGEGSLLLGRDCLRIGGNGKKCLFASRYSLAFVILGPAGVSE